MSNENRVGMFYVPKSAIGLNCETFDLFSKFVPTFAQVHEAEADGGFWGDFENDEEVDEIEYRGISPLFDEVKEEGVVPLYEVTFKGGIAKFEKSKLQPSRFGSSQFAVFQALYGSGAVSASNIQGGSISAGNIQAGSISGGPIPGGTVTTSPLGNGITIRRVPGTP